METAISFELKVSCDMDGEMFVVFGFLDLSVEQDKHVDVKTNFHAPEDLHGCILLVVDVKGKKINEIGYTKLKITCNNYQIITFNNF